MSDRRCFGLYVHWPFCQAKCPYCDFNSHVVDAVDQLKWQDAFRKEIERVQDDLPGRPLDTIFFGGGTPSLMSPKTVETIISAARAAWPFSNDMEITLEANPTSVEADKFQGFADAGVNRVSIGVQALNDDDLRKLGRLHSADEARRAVELAKSVFPSTSFDLIYARQNQSLEAWKDELSEALEMADGHLSLYQLTIEPGTAFGDRFARGRLRDLPNDDLAADMFEVTQDLTAASGLPAYEISNHASPGNESQHNMIYWRGHDWIGVGPGAHGRFTTNGKRIATESYLAPGAWLFAVNDGNGESLRRTLAPLEDTEERLMMGLRLENGVLTRDFKEYGNKFNELIEIGVLESLDGNVRATKRGKPVLNAILRELLS